MQKTKIGILGGTFNPVHMGHLILAQNAFEQLELSKVLFIPCSAPPHKKSDSLAQTKHRMAMLEAAVEDDLRFETCNIEIKRGGLSYTIDTIRELQQIYSKAEFFFIIGSDTLAELHLWKNVHEVLNLCRFVTFLRPGSDSVRIKPKALHLNPPWPKQLLDNVRAGKLIDISSSNIRYRVAEGMSIRYLVPTAVEIYISEHNLYSGRKTER
ncbi:nicotinate-nucleotide adenylyltransferase [Verrucomicrobiota bacterium]